MKGFKRIFGVRTHTYIISYHIVFLRHNYPTYQGVKSLALTYFQKLYIYIYIYNLTGTLSVPTIDCDQKSKCMKCEGEVISH